MTQDIMAPPSEPAQDEGPPLTELESLQLKANQVTDESLDSTRRMISLCEDSRGAGVKTIEMLEHQGEQLRRVEGNIDNVNDEMRQAEKHLTGMEKWCGLCVCPWSRTPRVRDLDATWGKAESSGVSMAQPRVVPDNGVASGSGGYIKRINNDAREDEMEENMGIVSGILGDLKSMAVDMGGQIEKQNKQLDRVNQKSEHVDLRINTANKRTEQLLK